MKSFLAKEHKDYFIKHAALELEGIFQDAQLATINASVLTFLTKEAALLRRTVSSVDPSKYFLAGRDLWRRNPEIKKILFHKRLSEIAIDLNFRPPFRIGSDQYVPKEYVPQKSMSLQEINSFQGLLFGYILCLKSISSESVKDPTVNPFPTTPGNIAFLGPDFPLDFKLLEQRTGNEYLLVTFIKDKSVYVFNENDPQTHFLKKFGYGFGDLLQEETHPIIYRS